MLQALDLADVALCSRDCNQAPGHSRCIKKLKQGTCPGKHLEKCDSRRMKQAARSLQIMSRDSVFETCMIIANQSNS